jgi:hypothetical protein
MRDDGGTGPLTRVSGRMGSKDPVGISGPTPTGTLTGREQDAAQSG